LNADLREGSGTSTDRGANDVLSGRDELARCKTMQVPVKHSSPMIFWRENASEFPLLSEVARRVICISARSAQSERVFSSVGRTITDARARLSPSTVEATEIVRWGCRAKLINLDY